MSVTKGKCYLKRKRFLNEVSQEILATLQSIYYIRNEIVTESVMKSQATKYAQTVEAACLTPKYKMSNDEYHNILHHKTHELCEVLKRNMLPKNNNNNNSNNSSNSSDATTTNSNGTSASVTAVTDITTPVISSEAVVNNIYDDVNNNNDCQFLMGSSHNSTKSKDQDQFAQEMMAVRAGSVGQKIQAQQSVPDQIQIQNPFPSFPVKEPDLYQVDKTDTFEIQGEPLFDPRYMKEDLEFGDAITYSFM